MLPLPSFVNEPPLIFSVPCPPSRPTASQLCKVTTPPLMSYSPVLDPAWAIHISPKVLFVPPVWVKTPVPLSPTMKAPLPLLLMWPPEKFTTPSPPRPMDNQLFMSNSAVPLMLLGQIRPPLTPSQYSLLQVKTPPL